MSSQFVDMNSDGRHDILAGSFSGVPQWLEAQENGFAKPTNVVDQSGETVLIANFWNYETQKWDTTERATSAGHCTSVSAVDWDADGDLDLILGDYYGGRLFLRLNEGNAKEAKYATTNQPIMVGGKAAQIDKGLAAPRIADWNGDGLFDIICGGAKGGVFLLENAGTKTTPQFDAVQTLIAPVDDSSNSYIKLVPTQDGEPTAPGSSFHVEPVDYDQDGDLDLLIGARSSWMAGPVKQLTDEEKARSQEVNQELNTLLAKLRKLTGTAKTTEERRQLATSKEYKTVLDQYRLLSVERQQYNTNPKKSGDFVWLYRRQ
ncbi:MAG: hypothetical protein CL681_24445 [Blastopirellula sp.]|nr:hypothetical protein [Blastopirellula sp.]